MPRKKSTNVDAVENNPAEKDTEIVDAPVKKRTGRTSKKTTADSAVDTAPVPTEAAVKKPRTKKAKASLEENIADTKTENVTVPTAAADITAVAAATVVKETHVKTEPAAAEKAPKRTPKAKKEPALAIATVLQVGGKEFDITNIAETALKAYKSVHKRKTVTDFVVYVDRKKTPLIIPSTVKARKSTKLTWIKISRAVG